MVVGDLHLGKRSGGIRGNPEEGSTRVTWGRIVDWCIGQGADLLFLTGDIIDRDNRYFEAAGPLKEGFSKLEKAGIKVFMVSGNHDFDVLPQVLQGAGNGNVRLLGKEGKWELAHFEKRGQVIQIAGWSFPRQYVYENPMISFSEISPDPNFPCIGLLHCDAAGGDSKYGPVSVDDFIGRQVSVWALGHIHKAQVLNESGPLVFYPGSPHALSAKENGAHGVVLMTVEADGRTAYEHVPLSPVRFEELRVDITGSSGEDDVRARIIRAAGDDAGKRAGEHPDLLWMVYDVILEGEHRSPREIAGRAGTGIEDYRHESPEGISILFRTLETRVRPVIGDLNKLAEEASPAGKLAETIIALREGRMTPFAGTLLEEWNKINKTLVDSAVYVPVRQEVMNPDAGGDGREYILRECHRLLGELMEQTSASTK